jgi:hypothetical protein
LRHTAQHSLRLREVVALTNTRALGLTDAVDSNIDGYLAVSDLDKIARDLSLRADPSGTVTLRVTGFNFERVVALAGIPIVAGLDAATSTDRRPRGVGRRVLTESPDATDEL